MRLGGRCIIPEQARVLNCGLELECVNDELVDDGVGAAGRLGSVDRVGGQGPGVLGRRQVAKLLAEQMGTEEDQLTARRSAGEAGRREGVGSPLADAEDEVDEDGGEDDQADERGAVQVVWRERSKLSELLLPFAKGSTCSGGDVAYRGDLRTCRRCGAACAAASGTHTRPSKSPTLCKPPPSTAPPRP